MPSPETTARAWQIRFARMYDDGSFNINRGDNDEATAIRRLSGSEDDDDTQLVEVEIRVIRWIAHKGLRVVAPTDIVRDALEQALDCIRGETPEDCSPDEAREDTVQKVRRALKALEGNSHGDAS
jgi:hypothetical protein